MSILMETVLYRIAQALPLLHVCIQIENSMQNFNETKIGVSFRYSWTGTWSLHNPAFIFMGDKMDKISPILALQDRSVTETPFTANLDGLD